MALRSDGSRRNGEEGVEARRQGRRVGGMQKRGAKRENRPFSVFWLGCVCVWGGWNPRGNEEKEGVRG